MGNVTGSVTTGYAADVARAAELRRPLEERAALKLVEEAQARVVEDFRAKIVPRMEQGGVPASFIKTARRVPAGMI